MKRYERILSTCVLCLMVAVYSCKKDSGTANKANLSSNNGVVSFTTSTQLADASIDATKHTINILVSYKTDLSALTANIELPSGATAVINGNKFNGGSVTLNYFLSQTIAVTAQNGSSATWTIVLTTDLEQYGFAGLEVTADKSLDKTYPWYIDQLTTGNDGLVNCGPASVTMAIKWADSTFTQTAEHARDTYPEGDGWWFTYDVTNYLALNGINWQVIDLPSGSQTQNMEKYIDQGDVLILCLDNSYLTYNSVATQHVGRFYQSSVGTGHFIVIKGYKRVDNQDYFDAYDPASMADTYPNTTNLKGQDRYYTGVDLGTATNVWWQFAIVVAPKGKQVTLATGMKAFSLPEKIPVQKGY